MTFTSQLATAFVLAMLSGAILIARARAQDPSSASDQSRRILVPAFAFSLSIAVYGGLALFSWADLPLLIAREIIVLFANGVGSLVLISVIDVAAMAMDARRTRAWLLVGIAVFVSGAALALLAFTGAFVGARLILTPDLAALMALAAAAALVWWAFLPLPARVADVFE